ncbi:8433_t:CDS:2 [Ambispora leptoticha]|uniref:8433_t:CDS:1 n=1 Tax=Ambispora leptoticha TaxID=144679 RepID=A0A9N9FCD3_9GLOM|nr:8433_t:CDS:2 [Ambispora leptoticha]
MSYYNNNANYGHKNFSFPNFGGGLKRTNSLSNDEIFDLLEWVGNRNRWTNYVYLLLIVWDFDRNNDFRGGHKFGQEYEKVEEHLTELFVNGGATQYQYNQVISSLENFAKFFRNRSFEEELRKQTLDYAYLQIGVRPSELHEEVKLLRDQLRRLSSDQRTRIPKDKIAKPQQTRRFSSDRLEMMDLKNTILELQKKNKKLTDLVSQSDEKIDALQDQAARYQEEASNYQAALGNAINVRWRDDDQNNAVNLSDDIEKLVHTLGSFTKVKGSGVKIREDAANQLLASYNCRTDANEKRGSKFGGKLLLAAALQLKILETIINHVKYNYKISNNKDTDAQEWIDAEEEWVGGSGFLVQEPFELPQNQAYDNNHHNNNLEIDIISNTNELIRLMSRLTEIRSGTDNFTPIAPIKVRQYVYAALGSRAFNDQTHPFISYLIGKIISIMDFYRELLDEQKKQELPNEAIELVLEVIHLFFFRLKAQPTIPEFRFFPSGHPLDAELMEGTWENIQKYEVEICYFPAIGINLGSKDRRVFTKARIITRPKSTLRDDEGDDD